MIDIEDLTEEELVTLEKYFAKLVRISKQEKNIHSSHSIEEAEALAALNKRNKP